MVALKEYELEGSTAILEEGDVTWEAKIELEDSPAEDTDVIDREEAKDEALWETTDSDVRLSKEELEAWVVEASTPTNTVTNSSPVIVSVVA